MGKVQLRKSLSIKPEVGDLLKRVSEHFGVPMCTLVEDLVEGFANEVGFYISPGARARARAQAYARLEARERIEQLKEEAFG